MIRQFVQIAGPGFLLIAAPHGAILAETSTASQSQATFHHERLYDSIQSGLDIEQMIVREVDAAIEALRALPPIAQRMSGKPNAHIELREAMMPVMRKRLERIVPLQRAETVALFTKHLTPVEAKTLADFYASPLGQKLLHSVEQNYDPSNLAEAAVRNRGRVSAESIDDAMSRAGERGGEALVANLSAAEQRRFEALAATPAFTKFFALSETTLAELQARYANLPPTPEERTELLAAFEKVLGPRPSRSASDPEHKDAGTAPSGE